MSESADRKNFDEELHASDLDNLGDDLGDDLSLVGDLDVDDTPEDPEDAPESEKDAGDEIDINDDLDDDTVATPVVEEEDPKKAEKHKGSSQSESALRNQRKKEERSFLMAFMARPMDEVKNEARRISKELDVARKKEETSKRLKEQREKVEKKVEKDTEKKIAHVEPRIVEAFSMSKSEHLELVNKNFETEVKTFVPLIPNEEEKHMSLKVNVALSDNAFDTENKKRRTIRTLVGMLPVWHDLELEIMKHGENVFSPIAVMAFRDNEEDEQFSYLKNWAEEMRGHEMTSVTFENGWSNNVTFSKVKLITDENISVVMAQLQGGYHIFLALGAGEEHLRKFYKKNHLIKTPAEVQNDVAAKIASYGDKTNKEIIDISLGHVGQIETRGVGVEQFFTDNAPVRRPEEVVALSPIREREETRTIKLGSVYFHDLRLHIKGKNTFEDGTLHVKYPAIKHDDAESTTLFQMPFSLDYTHERKGAHLNVVALHARNEERGIELSYPIFNVLNAKIVPGNAYAASTYYQIVKDYATGTLNPTECAMALKSMPTPDMGVETFMRHPIYPETCNGEAVGPLSEFVREALQMTMDLTVHEPSMMDELKSKFKLMGPVGAELQQYFDNNLDEMKREMETRENERNAAQNNIEGLDF